MSGFDIRNSLYMDGAIVPGNGALRGYDPTEPPPFIETFGWWSYAVSRTNGQYMLAGTYDGDHGYVWRSADTGVTWARVTPIGVGQWRTLGMSAAGTIMVAAAYSLYDGTTPGKAWLSNNAGVDWVEITDVGSATWSNVVVSSNGAKIFLCDDAGAVWLSSDSGANFDLQVAPLPNCVTGASAPSVAADDAATIIYATGNDDNTPAELYKSTDSGATWSTLTPFALAGGRYNALACSSDGAIVYLSADEDARIAKSTDSGGTFADLATSPTYSNLTIACSANGAVVVAAENGNTVSLSSDTGATWASVLTKDALSPRNLGIAMSASGAVILTGSYDVPPTQGIYVSTNTGGAWAQRTPS